MRIEATGILPFEKEPMIEEVENQTALYLSENLMKVESDENFYVDDRYTLTYEEIN
jgi:hypothetical protein